MMTIQEAVDHLIDQNRMVWAKNTQRTYRNALRRFCTYLQKGEGIQPDAKPGQLVRSAPPRTYFPELAYWNPRVTTDETGHATVRIVLPDTNTKWKLVARGVTAETLVGSSEAEVISKTDFFVELLTPPNLIEGDKLHPAARVHCLTPYKGKIDLTLRVHNAEPAHPDVPRKDETQLHTLVADGSGVYDVEFDAIEVADAGELVFGMSAQTRADVPDAKRPLSDAIAHAVPVRPWGLRIEAHAAGLAGDNEFVEVELPKLEGTSGEYHDLRLTVAAGSSMQRWLIEEALESGERWKRIPGSSRTRSQPKSWPKPRSARGPGSGRTSPRPTASGMSFWRRGTRSEIRRRAR